MKFYFKHIQLFLHCISIVNHLWKQHWFSKFNKYLQHWYI